MYAYLEKNPAKAQQFSNAIKSFTSYIGQQPKYLVEGYDWDSVGDGLVVDVGGAEGFMSIAIAEKFPSLNFIVQELPEVAKSPKEPTQ